NDADDLVVAYHRQSLDIVSLHQIDDSFQFRLFADCHKRLGGHDRRNLAAVLLHEVGSRPAGTKDEFQEAAASALRADFAAANEVALGKHADQLARGVHDRKAADVLSQHDDRGLRNPWLRGT